MYLEHFGLKEPPFRLSPDPHFLFLSRHHSRAKAYMESTVLLEDGFVIITGEIGSGKTTLIKSFIEELGGDVTLIYVTQTQLSPVQFLQALLSDLGFKPYQKRKVELLDMFNQFLIEQYGKGKKVVMIVDEAQNLSARVLEEIRLLSGIETTNDKVLRIILAGQPELSHKLEKMPQLVQRVRLRFHLGPLSKAETQEYAEHRLEVAGGEGRLLFEPETYDLVFRYSGGIPRLINTLCDTAMLCAFAEEKKRIDVEDIKAAVTELGWVEFCERTGSMAVVTEAQAMLSVRCKGEPTREIPLSPGRIIIGRTSDNDLQIDSKYISRHHAQIVSNGEGSTIEDLNSTNGIYLNHKRIKKHSLQHGDTILFGQHEVTYLVKKEEAAA